DCVLSLGVVNGRNIWRNDLSSTLDMLEPLHQRLGNRLWIAPSCSLLHVPVDLASEQALDAELLSWLAFAQQKVEEVTDLGVALTQGREAVTDALAASTAAKKSPNSSVRVNNPHVRAAVEAIDTKMGQRRSPY